MFDLKSINQSFEQFKEKVKEEQEGKKDSRFWNFDKKQQKAYKIRFLPYKSKDGNWKFYIKRYRHFLVSEDGNLRYQQIVCPTSIGEKCYICEKSWEFYNSAFESDREIGLKRGRKTEYLANILVLNDPVNPENEGKVFIFRFGKTIADKILAAMGLQKDVEDDIDDDIEITNVFDPINGWDFKLVVKRKGEYPDYSNSEFIKKKRPIFPNLNEKERMKKIDEIISQTYDLDEFINPDIIPSYEETKQIYIEMFGKTKSKMVEEEPEEIEETTETFEDDVPDEEIIDNTSSSEDDEDFDDIFDE